MFSFVRCLAVMALGGLATACGAIGTTPADTYTITSSFGYTKTKAASGWTQDVIYGVPLGTHTFSIVAGWRPDAKSAMPSRVTAVVQY
jgi:hypothetical protein